jgi:acyl-CoA reductase-like NAD-dependent aldehyde dehydrogenase
MFSRDTFLIGGQFAMARGTEFFDIISPSTEEIIGQVPVAIRADVDAAVAAARRSFEEGPWPRMKLEERIEIVQRLVPLMSARLDELVSLQVGEMGSPVRFMGPLTEAVINDSSVRSSRRLGRSTGNTSARAAATRRLSCASRSAWSAPSPPGTVRRSCCCSSCCPRC